MKVRYDGPAAAWTHDGIWEPGEVREMAECPNNVLFVVVEGSAPSAEAPVVVEEPAPAAETEEVGDDGK